MTPTLAQTCDNVKAYFQDQACCGPSGNKAVCTAPTFDGATVTTGTQSLLSTEQQPWLVKYEKNNFVLEHFYDPDAYVETLMANEDIVKGSGNCPGTTGYMTVILGDIDVTGTAFNEPCFGGLTNARSIFPNNFPPGKWRADPNVKIMEEAMKLAFDVETCFGIDVTKYQTYAEYAVNHAPFGGPLYPQAIIAYGQPPGTVDITAASEAAIAAAANSSKFHTCRMTEAQGRAVVKRVLDVAPQIDAAFATEMNGSIAQTVTAPLIRTWLGHMNVAAQLSGYTPETFKLTESTTVKSLHDRYEYGGSGFFSSNGTVSFEIPGVVTLYHARSCLMPRVAAQAKEQVQAALAALIDV